MWAQDVRQEVSIRGWEAVRELVPRGARVAGVVEERDVPFYMSLCFIFKIIKCHILIAFKY